MADRLIRITTALTVVPVTAVVVISYRHAYELVRQMASPAPRRGSYCSQWTGLIWAAPMVILDASRRKLRVTALAKWSLD